ncbi:YceK/YidQ family lipoprotein [Erwinia sorbitola]|uniref:YceK/YidQ family lipoprotein n=1 Tax=Erwinia sorbitola TaxID=2681984 RepID=A0A6I6EH02_9GAMM|nr:YceK/YidQ family lipoprotein [Erwinia sorbitola]MTD28008.1 YceK/YidQ family lipoprotein [Erwinia sorbitola]QGU85706.1 YceK/YidQ family lipoprotein [Erwinia sorbitola]
MKALKKCHIAGMVACISLVSSSGCSSVMMHSGPSDGYYPGTRASARVLTEKDSGWVMKPLAAIDLPFSAVLDTLLLPLDYFRAGNNDNDSDSPRERVRRSEQANHTDEVMSQTMAPYAANSPAP